jgi:hypothetical protein
MVGARMVHVGEGIQEGMRYNDVNRVHDAGAKKNGHVWQKKMNGKCSPTNKK